jgi:two-component system sensor histidine kinase GlrK
VSASTAGVDSAGFAKLPDGSEAGGARAQRLRGSFQQLLLIAFLVIAALTGGIALRSVFTFDDLIAQSRGFSERALQLSGAVQQLVGSSAVMERAGRQSLILNDQLLRKRFDESAKDASALLSSLVPDDATPALAQSWHKQLDAITALFAGSAETAIDRERTMAAAFRDLEQINGEIAGGVQHAIEERNKTMTTQLDNSRARLTRLVFGSIAFSVALAVALGLWLARPFKRIERAIIGLGENRLGTPIVIRGPADVRRIGIQLDWLRLRLSELDADKARFLRHISHELKTPLAAMREGVSLLEDGVAGPLTESQREVARILQHNTVVLQSQIEGLLRFNAAAFEARQLKRDQVDLLQLVEEQVDAQRLQWQAHELLVRIEGEAVRVQIDAAKIATVIDNLLSNAIRFSPQGSTIGIRIGEAPGWARIEIRDEGPGVAEGDRQRIFEPFYRGERQPDNAARGTGVGLSIVQEYIAAHGGRIALLPSSGGAHFIIELPHAA